MVMDCGLRAPRPLGRLKKLWRAQVYAAEVRARNPRMQITRHSSPVTRHEPKVPA